MKTCYRLLLWSLLMPCVGGLLTGCCTKTPSGQIYLDHPEVFTRERLVNRRLAELQWLEKELDRPVTSTFQGAREQRSFSALTAQIEAQFDPLTAAGAMSALATAQSTQKVAQLQNDLVATALQQKLRDLQDGRIKYTDVLGTNPVSVASPPGAPTFTPTNAAIGMPGAFTNLSALPALPSASNLVFVSDRVQLTASEQFRDRLAYRDTVSATMREKELDDTHDHAGMTLYTLKFDLSVVPGRNNAALGRAAVTIAPPAKDNPEERYTFWVESFRRTFDTEVISIQRRFLQHYLSDEEFRRLAVASWKAEDRATVDLHGLYPNLESDDDLRNLRLNLQSQMKEKLKDDEARKLKSALEQLQAVEDYRALRAQPKPAQPSAGNQRAILRALCRLITWRFSEALSNASPKPLVFFGQPKEAGGYGTDSDGFLFLVPVQTNAETGTTGFSSIEDRLETNAQPFIYTVEPKENAQNLSDVSARETVRNLSLALAAAVPQLGTRASAYVNYLKRQQYLLETIKRSPLLVGFIEDQTHFGWIIGPRFKIGKNLSLDFEQTALQESVQATIAVPAWWHAIGIDTTNEWLDDKAGSLKDLSRSCTSSSHYDVRLRPEFAAFTRALLERFDPVWFNGPQIHPRWDVDERKRGYVVTAGKPAQLLILGRNLWRNPQIFIGSQATRKYEVLPDMAGLLAIFDEIQPVQTLDASDDVAPTVDLRVVTSDGETVLKNAVSTLSGRRPGQQPAFVKMPQAWAVAGQNYSFDVDKTLAPRAYDCFFLTLKARGFNAATVATNTDPSVLEDAKLTFQLPQRPAAEKTFVNVQLKTAPGSDPVGVLEGGEQPLVLFLGANQSQFRVETDSIIISTNPAVTGGSNSFKVLLPDPDKKLQTLFWQAWPGLQQALDTGSAQLRLKADTAEATSKPALFDTNHQTFLFNFDYDTLVNKLPLSNDGSTVQCDASVVVPASDPRFTIRAGKITIKRKNN